MMEKTKNCVECGQLANYKEGNKNGKPWAGYFCSDLGCKHVEWVALKVNEPKPVVKPAGKEVNTDMMRLAYRKDLMVALINTGILEATDKFEDLWKIIEK
jgi:hypothetical protein